MDTKNDRGFRVNLSFVLIEKISLHNNIIIKSLSYSDALTLNNTPPREMDLQT